MAAGSIPWGLDNSDNLSYFMWDNNRPGKGCEGARCFLQNTTEVPLVLDLPVPTYTDLTMVLQTTIKYLDVYVLPLLVLVGLVGNLLCVTVFVATYMRRLSSSIYLAALSIADAGFLICVLISWAWNTGLDLYNQEGWCQTFVYMTYISSFLSVWYVVSFTVERYVAVHFPLRRLEICTPKRAKIVVVCLALFSLGIYSFSSWMFGVTHTPVNGFQVCGPLPEHAEVVSILNNVDTVITLIFPFLAILIMNLKIAAKVAKFYRHKQVHNNNYYNYHKCTVYGRNQGWRQKGRTKGAQGKQQKTLYTRTQVRITKLLLIVSTIFLLLNLPRHTLRVYTFIMSLLDPEYSPSSSYLLLEKFFMFLYYLNFCMNLLLFSALGKNFRRAFQWLLRRIKYACVQCIERHTLPSVLMDGNDNVGTRGRLAMKTLNTARTSALYL